MTATVAERVAEAGIQLARPEIFQTDNWAELFALLRREDAVHYVSESPYGPYWSITRFDDIKEIEQNTAVFSSDIDCGGISIEDVPPEINVRSFFLMDPPEHGRHRAVVNQLGLPRAVEEFDALIRKTTQQVLDGLPRDEIFDWVDRVSIEITSTMLAALMDYPMEHRRQLVHWTEVVTTSLDDPCAVVTSEAERQAQMQVFFQEMIRLWESKRAQPARFDLLSILAHNELMDNLPVNEKMGILITFLVGGNDTTRNTMTGGLWALWKHPEQLKKLRRNHELLPTFVQESLRWHTPVMNMRRTALADMEFKGRSIKKGDKVVLWYLSANRDEKKIDRPDHFRVDRDHASRHLTFGYGIHRCLGARLAELQLRILWEEFFRRDLRFEVIGDPVWVYSPSLRSIRSMKARIYK